MTAPPPTALVVAHPGHEVRIHGLLEQERPQKIFILTDGSSYAGQPRIASTTRYMAQLSIEPGGVYGRMTDSEVYRAVLARDFDFFVGLSDELAGAFAEDGVERVVGDASEGYNTTHDIYRLVSNAAVEMASRADGRRIANYDFPVVNRPDHCPDALRAQALWLNLDEDTFRRKLAAAREFYPELVAEVDDAVHGRGDSPLKRFLERGNGRHGATGRGGIDMFRVECLRPVSDGDSPFETASPFYELQGERRVVERKYEQVIRYREHVAPLADALQENVERKV